MKVYLIDDDSEEAELFRDAIGRMDDPIEFVWFDDVIEGLDALLKESTLPDMLFLDLNIPQVSGKQMLKLLRENRVTKDLPVVIYSTSISKKDMDDTSIYGVKFYLQKPESFEKLCVTLRELITGQ